MRCESKNGHMRDMCLKRDWTTCSEVVLCLRFNSQHVYISRGVDLTFLLAQCM